MGHLIVDKVNVCVLQLETPGNQKEDMEKVKDELLDLVNSDAIQSNPFPTFVFIDLQHFTIINSSLIGAMGSVIMDEKIQMLGLCGVSATVMELLFRFGVVAEDNIPKEFSSTDIQDNFDKTVIFDTLRDGVSSLV
jgi:hypothetical protein